MRKLTILLAVAALTTSVGCGPCRGLFSKGSPCGTAMASPAILSAPMAMSAPMAQPNMCAPMCVPCDPCLQYDPCASQGVTTGYMGNYLSSPDCKCNQGSGAIITPQTQIVPGPVPVSYTHLTLPTICSV